MGSFPQTYQDPKWRREGRGDELRHEGQDKKTRNEAEKSKAN